MAEDDKSEERKPEQMTPQQPVLQTPQGVPGVPSAPAPAPAADVAAQDFTQQDINDLINERKLSRDKYVGDIDALIAERRDLVSHPLQIPRPPAYQNIPQPPDMHPQSFKDAMPGLIFSTVMGALTSRRKGMDAMNAAAEYMNGFKAGDKERMDLARQKWQDASTAVTKQNNIDNQRYNDVLNNRSLAQADRMSQIATIAHEIGDRQIQAGIDSGQMDFVHKLIQDRQKANTQVEVAKIKASMTKPEQVALQRYMQENPHATADDINAFIRAGKQPRGGPGMALAAMMEERRAAGNPMSSEEIIQANADIQGRAAAERFKQGGPARAISQAMVDNERKMVALESFTRYALANGRTLLKLAEKADPTGIPVMNRWINKGRVGLAGDPDITNFNSQLRGWKTEIARIMSSGNMTGVLTDTARKEADDFVPDGATLPQLRGLMKLFEQDAKNRRDTFLETQRELLERMNHPTSIEPSAVAPVPNAAPAPADTGGWR